MTVETIKATKAAALGNTPAMLADVRTAGGRVRFFYDTVTTTGTTTTNGSTYKFGPFPSNAMVKVGSLQGDGTIDLPDVDVGLVHVDDADIADDDCIITALDIDDTGDHFFINEEVYAATNGQALWEYVSGLTGDPGGQFYIMCSLDADAVAAGTFAMRVEYTVD